ncbi:hypothetical protein M3152_12225 [Sporosarcina luteola]|uniref:hypothetical protein n=1 Tax=Sporosarcina luteola TaxID=582850 RepID=UPI00203D88AE|nr:hypothetical protein [Sporosarcina luteola]MCM3638468.1 hypothetical protein [Sporosarcina luteola]
MRKYEGVVKVLLRGSNAEHLETVRKWVGICRIRDKVSRIGGKVLRFGDKPAVVGGNRQ